MKSEDSKYYSREIDRMKLPSSSLHSRYGEILKDYYRLSIKIALSEFEEKRMQRILEMGVQDGILSLLLNEIDELSFNALGIEVEQEQIQKAYIQLLSLKNKVVREELDADKSGRTGNGTQSGKINDSSKNSQISYTSTKYKLPKFPYAAAGIVVLMMASGTVGVGIGAFYINDEIYEKNTNLEGLSAGLDNSNFMSEFVFNIPNNINTENTDLSDLKIDYSKENIGLEVSEDWYSQGENQSGVAPYEYGSSEGMAEIFEWEPDMDRIETLERENHGSPNYNFNSNFIIADEHMMNEYFSRNLINLFEGQIGDGSGRYNRINIAGSNNFTSDNDKLLLPESYLMIDGELSLQTGNTVLIRDGLATPFLASSGNDLLIQGDPDITLEELDTSVSTAGGQGSGSITIRHDGGVQAIPFVVGDASNNRTDRAITSAPGSMIVPMQSFPSSYVLGNISIITSSSNGTSMAGDIYINNAGTLIAQDRASLSASNLGSGNAGNITVTAEGLFSENQGNISLRSGSLLQANTADNADGGNITISIPASVIYGVPQENTDIIASATSEGGGQIIASAPTVSDISASSTQGIPGTVDITTLNITPNQGLSILPEEPQGSEATIGTSGNIHSEEPFFVHTIEVSGNTVLQEEIASLISPFENREVISNELVHLSSDISQLYATNGYGTSGAIIAIPNNQDVSDGVVQIQVIEGNVESVGIEGLERLQDNYILDRILPAFGPPLNIDQLQVGLKQLQQDPSIENISATIQSGEAPGEDILLIRVEEANTPLTVKGESLE